MVVQIKAILFKYYDELFNRKFFLSFPKSGRTWMLNVFSNYHIRTLKSNVDPIPFLYNQREGEGRCLLRDTGIVFSHGYRLRNKDFYDMKSSLKKSCIAKRKTCLMVRNPARVLYSYFIHNNNKIPDFINFKDFLEHNSLGLKAYASYHEYIISQLLNNQRGLIIKYEDLHESEPNNFINFTKLFSFYFDKDLDLKALKWAVESCRIEALRSRMVSNNEFGRVRDCKIGINKEDLLFQFIEFILNGLTKYCSVEVKNYFLNNYFHSI